MFKFRLKLLLASLTLLFVVSTTSAQLIDDPMKTRNKKYQSIRKRNGLKKESWYEVSVARSGKKKRGPLISVEEYNEQGLCIKQTAFLGGMEHSNTFDYDENGNSLSDVKLNSTKKNEYNSKGELTKSSYFDKKTGKLLEIEAYDTLQLKRSSIRYNQDGEIIEKTETLYEPQDKIYTSRLVSMDGFVLYENKYYLNDSLQVERCCVTDNIQYKKYCNIFKYDDRGNEIECLEVDAAGNPKSKILSRFNALDCEVESIYFNPVDKIKRIIYKEQEYFK